MSRHCYVVKVGGGASLRFDALYDDVQALVDAGNQVVLVHGGNAELTALQERLGTPARFVSNGAGRTSRYTDGEAIEQFSMVYAGQLNVRHVCALRARGVDALGLTGVDGGLLTGQRRARLVHVEDGKKQVLRDDHAGSLERVNDRLLRTLLAEGYTPVVTVPAYADGPDGAAGAPINVDGDRAAAAIAEALDADALVYLSDVPGLLADPRDPASLIHTVHDEPSWSRARAAAQGRMFRKVEGVARALEHGVGLVAIAPANHRQPVRAVLSGASGTSFRGPVPAREADGAPVLEATLTTSAAGDP